MGIVHSLLKPFAKQAILLCMKALVILAALFLGEMRTQSESERMYDDVQQVLMIEHWQGPTF